MKPWKYYLNNRFEASFDWDVVTCCISSDFHKKQSCFFDAITTFLSTYTAWTSPGMFSDFSVLTLGKGVKSLTEVKKKEKKKDVDTK